jgi:uncharacterized repeat protein (TIGR03803 family)
LPAGCGIVFELSPSANGWAETILYEFTGINGQGAAPNSALTWDRLGNLYGTTEDGGSQRSGTLFRLSPAAGGGWNQEVIYDFGSGSDGKYPTGNLILGAGGVLYGTNIGGGAAGGIGNDGQGTVFEVVP